MPVTIPPGTKFEAIKPTTAVNRRSALVNANDQTFTIEDIAAAAGGTFPITNNYIPRANSSGSIVDSNLYQDDQGFGTGLFGDFSGGIGINSFSGINLINIINDNLGGYSYVHLGDVFGGAVPFFGLQINSNVVGPSVIMSTNGINVLEFYTNTGAYQFGGLSSRFGIINGDMPQASLYITPDLVTNVAGTEYIKVLHNGIYYKIELIP
jgi:hypothetical protein